jgi:hypothetical protein
VPKRTMRFVVFPRYSTLVGTTPVYSPPLDVREFGEAIFTSWMGTGIGSTPAEVEFEVQTSTDLVDWVDAATITMTAGDEEVTEVEFDLPWIRVRATVSGGDPGVSFWMTVELVRREGAQEGEAA